MADSKRPLSIRIPADIYDAIAGQASETGLSITDVATALLANALGQPVPTPSDRLAALEKEVASLRGKLRGLAA